MIKSESICRVIVNALDENGELPKEFHLPQEPSDDGSFRMRWDDGAEDGVAIYHVRHHAASEETIEDLRQVVRTASDGDFDAAAEALRKAGARDGAYDSAGVLLKMVWEGRDRMDMGNLMRFAADLLANSSDKESVKYAIWLIGIFRACEEIEDIRMVLQILARSDEFTYYVATVVSEWSGGNELVFEMAQHVHGWGRIHCVECLKPETEEIREWLLTEGFRNTVMEKYSALTCLKKSGAEQRVRETLTPEEFTAIGDMIYTLICRHRPVPGIEGLENAEEFLLNWVYRAEEVPLQLDDYQYLLELLRYCRDRMETGTILAEIYGRCAMLLNTREARWMIESALDRGNWSVLRLADETKIDFEPYILDRIREDFEKACPDAHYLKNAPRIRELLNICREKMPPEAIGGYTKEVIVLRRTIRDNASLRGLLRCLEGIPMLGADYVAAALASDATIVQKGAADVLLDWVWLTGMPLSQLSQGLYDAARTAAEGTKDDELRKKLDKLFQGDIRR